MISRPEVWPRSGKPCFSRWMDVALILLAFSAGCNGMAAAEKAEKERANKYMDQYLKIVEDRNPGGNGPRSDEKGLKAVEEIEAIPTTDIPAEVVANAKGWAAWLKKGIETKERGGFTKEKIKEWKEEGNLLNLAGGTLREKYK